MAWLRTPSIKSRLCGELLCCWHIAHVPPGKSEAKRREAFSLPYDVGHFLV